MKFKIFIIIFSCIINIININSSQITKIDDNNIDIPDYNSFIKNSDLSKPFLMKKVTVYEYITDPLILYSSMWLCFGITLPFWEQYKVKYDINRISFITDTYDNGNLIYSAGNQYADRIRMEPFVSGSIETTINPVLDSDNHPVKDEFGNTKYQIKPEFFAKNFIEPYFFINAALYLKSKNYHIALIIGEVFTLSLLYEFTLRPLFMPSSFEQLLKSPAIGIGVAIMLDEISCYLLTTPYTGLHILAYFLNPFNAFPTNRVHGLIMLDNYKQAVSIEAIIKL